MIVVVISFLLIQYSSVVPSSFVIPTTIEAFQTSSLPVSASQSISVSSSVSSFLFILQNNKRRLQLQSNNYYNSIDSSSSFRSSTFTLTITPSKRQHISNNNHNVLLLSSLDNTMEQQQSRLDNTKESDDNNNNDDDTVLVTWLDESDVTENVGSAKTSPSSTTTTTTTTKSTTTTWGSKLSPKIKDRIIYAGQQRAIQNKQKRTSDMDRKRRQLLFMKDRQREKKRSMKIDRPIPLSSSYAISTSDIERIPLHIYQPGMQCYGTCISLTNFGAYIDIGTECDGLLHITQMQMSSNTATSNGSSSNNNRSQSRSSSSSRSTSSTSITTTFINHPKQIVQPGDEILVTVRSINPDRKKLHLTMLPWDTVQEQLAIELEMKSLKRASFSNNDEDDDDDNNTNNRANTISYTDRIPLSDIQIDDELWGEIKRVTNFGAYIEVGAIVDGFLHYMDHPSFTYEYNKRNYKNGGLQQSQTTQPIHPTSIMQTGDRVRVWVSDLDTIRNRIKLTAHRPNHLPGPRREI